MKTLGRAFCMVAMDSKSDLIRRELVAVASRKLRALRPVLMDSVTGVYSKDDFKTERITPVFRCNARRGIIRHFLITFDPYVGFHRAQGKTDPGRIPEQAIKRKERSRQLLQNT
jgi:hypothetical protein